MPVHIFLFVLDFRSDMISCLTSCDFSTTMDPNLKLKSETNPLASKLLLSQNLSQQQK